MKILILTMPLGENIGGLLQAFALQNTLTKMGNKVLTVDIDINPTIAKRLRWKTINHVLRLLNKTSETYHSKSSENIFYRNLYKFKEENLNLSIKCKSHEDIQNLITSFSPDYMIVGSDQVWRKNAVLNIESMFLNFKFINPCQCISYAASLGKAFNSYNDLENEEISSHLSDFKSVSVREDSAKIWLKNSCNIHSSVVLDPVLLAGSETFTSLTNEHELKMHDNYFVEYILDKTQETDFIIEYIKLNIPYKKVRIGSKKKLHNCNKSEVYESGYPEVTEWIGYIKHAKYVVTDSYHGVLFSLLYRRPFIVIGNQYRGLSRLYSILEKLDLRDRIIFDYTDIQKVLNKEINWVEVEDKITKLRDFSRDFLIDSINKT